MKNVLILQLGAFIGALAVALGAFGAHAFKPMLQASGRLDTFETAVKYQFYHALVMLVLGLLMQHVQAEGLRYLQWAGYAFLVGVVVFSGALYAICFTGITAFGAVAPIGGTALIVGWLLLLWGAKFIH